jgi:hypothetical protein
MVTIEMTTARAHEAMGRALAAGIFLITANGQCCRGFGDVPR